MNTKFIASAIVAVAAMTSASAFAQSHQYGEAALVIAPVTLSSNLTRAQVNAEYLKARQNGTVAVSNEGAFAAAPVVATNLNRATVHAQAVIAAQLNGNSSI